MTESLPVLETIQLTKEYGAIHAVANLDLAVTPGEIFGFLGPNGSGKTTTIRMLLRFVRPTSGEARLFGIDSWKHGVSARRDLGYLVSLDSLYPAMTGQDQLDFAARLSARPPVLREKLIDALDLDREALDRKVNEYSRGMRQKLSLIMAIQDQPALLILDEPTEGLDPLIRRNLEQLLREINQRGTTIFMSSHDLAEVERLCDRLAVIRSGQLVAQGSVSELRSRHLRRVQVTFRDDPPDQLSHLPGVSELAIRDRRAEFVIETDIDQILPLLASAGVEDLVILPASLDDIFASYYKSESAGS